MTLPTPDDDALDRSRAGARELPAARRWDFMVGVFVSLLALFSIAASLCVFSWIAELHHEPHSDAGIGVFFAWLLFDVPSFAAAAVGALFIDRFAGPPKTLLFVAGVLAVAAYPAMRWIS